MTLINSDGIALIGPGSEWFWTMAQFAAVVVTLSRSTDSFAHKAAPTRSRASRPCRLDMSREG